MDCFDRVTQDIARLDPWLRLGRITRLDRGLVTVRGLSDLAATGDILGIGLTGERRGEVIAVHPGELTVLADGAGAGLRLGTAVRYLGPCLVAPDDSWIGRVIDPFGRPLSGLPLLPGPVQRQIHAQPPEAQLRRPLGERLETGLSVFNSFLPIARGQRVGLFAGSGVGKSTLLGQLTLGVQADVIVIALIGERGRELRDFTQTLLGARGMARSVVVAATSDQPALVRRRCILTAMAVAEHFRDAGRQVLFLADSLTRFAEAHREIALAADEPPSLRGFPPSTVSQIAGLCERAGPGTGAAGDITAIFTVLVAGSDMDEPVADIVRAVLDGHIILDRQIAERGRFPSVDLLRSVSRSLPEAASPQENALLTRTRALLGRYERAELMIQAGLYLPGSDPELDIAIRLWPALDDFLGSDEPGSCETSFERLEAILAAAGALAADAD